MYREILTFADPSDAGLARVLAAETLADRYRAHLDVEIIEPLAEAEAAPADVLFAGRPYGDVLEAVREVKNAAAMRVRAVLPRAPEFYAVHQREIASNHIRAFATHAAHTADLVVAAKPDDEILSRREADILMGALIEGGAPCLALPAWEAPRRIGARILIAWRAGPEAARAVHAALTRFETYLVRHGAKLEETSAIESWEGPEPAFKGELEGFGADLLVMGVFHHAPLHETMFGGMTVTPLRDAPCAVLLSH